MAKFIDVFEDVTRLGKKIPTSEYLITGKYPIIDQGQNYIAGYTDKEDGLFEDVPVVIFGDHTRVIKYIDKPFFLGADGVKVLKAKFDNANYKYLYYVLSSAKIPDTGYNRHFKWLKEINIPNFSEQKQKQIVEELDKVSLLIEQRKQQLSKLDELVKSRFVELFEGCNYPICRLGDVCAKITDGTHKTPNYLESGVTFISAKNIVNGELDFTDVKYISDDEYAEIQKRCQTEMGDILISKSGSLGAPVIVKTTERIGLFESLAVLKYDRSSLLPAFLCEQLKSDNVQRQFRVGTKGVAIKHLHLGVIADTNIVVPPIDVQNIFAAFVEQTDKAKLEIKQSLEKLETLKKSLMQQYFG